MYMFIAHYTNMDTEHEITKEVYFDGQFFANDRECWIYATGKAFDLCEKNECFDSIELLFC